MNRNIQLLIPENVILDLEVGSKKRVFEHIALLFENNYGIAQSTIFDSLFAREKLGSTGLGKAIAIPHGRIKGLKEARGAFVRLAAPIPFDSPDGKPVSLLYALLVPEQATEQHLEILSGLAERFADTAFREALIQAKTAEEVCHLFDVPAS